MGSDTFISTHGHSANSGGYRIEHTNKAYDKESGKIMKFYAINDSKKCYQ